MRRLGKALLVIGLGAAGGGIAALAGYAVRGTQRRSILDISASIPVEELTLSVQRWAIVGLLLLGALVCGPIAFVAARRNRLLALLVAAPVGAFMCWGARALMDVMVRAAVGGAQTVDPIQALQATGGPWLVWQAAVAVGLTVPIALGIGINTYTVIRSVIGMGLVIVLSNIVSAIVGVFLVGAALGGAVRGQMSLDISQIADVTYLFTMGLSAGLAFAIADAVYKPAWLKSLGGRTEGRSWTLARPVSRIGSMEGLEVFIPPDGTVAPVHAQIHAQEEGHYIADLVGNTFVNGQPVAPTAWLRDGDRIGIGSAQLVYKSRLTSAPRGQTGVQSAPMATAPFAPVEPVQQAPASMAPLAAAPPRVALTDTLGNRFELRPGVNLVGRDATCDVALTWEQSVSRRHAEVTVDPLGTMTVSDLGSTNGTFVAGVAVTGPTPLTMGHEVAFGSAKLRATD